MRFTASASMVKSFQGSGVAPAFDSELGEGCAVLGTDDSKECMQASGVFERELIPSVEDRLGFGIDGPVKKEKIWHEGFYVGPMINGAAEAFGFGVKSYSAWSREG